MELERQSRALENAKKKNIDKIIGENIRRERKSRGMSRDELSEIMDITTAHLGLIERGLRGAVTSNLYKLSKIFDIPIGAFFESSTTSVRGDYENDNAKLIEKRAKVTSLITRLSDKEIRILIQFIKVIICLTHNENDTVKEINENDDDVYEE